METRINLNGGHLKQLHASIKLAEKILTSGTHLDQNFSSFVTLMKLSNPTMREWFVFFSNIDGKKDVIVDLQADDKYFVPA